MMKFSMCYSKWIENPKEFQHSIFLVEFSYFYYSTVMATWQLFWFSIEYIHNLNDSSLVIFLCCQFIIFLWLTSHFIQINCLYTIGKPIRKFSSEKLYEAKVSSSIWPRTFEMTLIYTTFIHSVFYFVLLLIPKCLEFKFAREDDLDSESLSKFKSESKKNQEFCDHFIYRTLFVNLLCGWWWNR